MESKKVTDRTSVFDKASEEAFRQYVEVKAEALTAIVEAHSFVVFALGKESDGKGIGLQIVSSIMGKFPELMIVAMRENADKLEKIYAENLERLKKEEGNEEDE